MSEPSALILIVDDTEASRYSVSHLLRKAGFTVLEAATGEQALRLMERRPDLVILDVNLPDMSGYDVCRHIKTTPATSSVLVMHLSASFVSSEDRSQGLESGADGYLIYPLEPRELVANVQAMLRIRRAEKMMRSQRELLHITLNSIGDAIIATDAQGIVTFINPVAQKLIGWSEAESVGKPLTAIFHIVSEETGQPVQNPVEKVILSGRVVGLANHTILLARDGTRRPIDDTAAPIRDEDGQFVGVVLVFRDIAERRRLENELRLRSEDLAERDRRKDEFLAMLAHELRNPLAPLANTVQMLRLQFAGQPEIARAGAVMERQLNHLVRLVDDLLDVSRITRGKFELRKQRIELTSVIGRIVESVRPLMEERQHQLHIELAAEPLRLTADPDRVEQVLANLLTNAAKYTPPSGEIQLSAQREADEIVLRVRDNGIGIRSEVLPRLFDMFQQADRVPGRVSEGLGIGLTLVRSLVEMHGGSVSAMSAGPNQGSEFVVRLPALPSGIAEASPCTVEASATPARPLRVLITDDNCDSATSMAMLLGAMGHQARTARDGPQALEVIENFSPDVLFLDIGLPRGMDGYELARRLRQHPGMEKALLVAMTGYGQEEDRQKSMAAGFNHHLVKPANLSDINRLLSGVTRL
ncbi:MAG TPA: response regulator [Gemmataceae bacterium]|jgi:PAS domain S-box-containing protein